MSTAAFRARNITTAGAWSNFSDGGFDAAAGDVIEVELESSPALDIWMTQFSCVDRSSGRTAPVFTPSTGIASVPTAAVRFTMPAGEHGTWAIQCQTNGGPQGPDGRPDPDFTKVRFFAVRTPALELRHPLAAETIEYLAAGGWAVAIQEMMTALDAFAAGAGVYIAGAGLTESPAGTFNVVADADGSITVAANSIKVGILATDAQHGNRGGGALHANVVAAGAAGFMTGADKTKLDGIEALADVTDFANVAAALAAASASLDFNGQILSNIAPADQPTDAVTMAQLDDAIAALSTSVTTTLAGYMPTTWTLTAGAGLTGGGDGSADRTVNVAAADLSITVNADSIEASGNFVAKNLQTTGYATFGAAGVTHTMLGVLDSRYDGLSSGRTVGRRLRNTTASDAVNTLRYSPSDDFECHAWVSGADRTGRWQETLEMSTGGTITYRYQRDLGTGSGHGDAFVWFSASPLQAVSGIGVSRVVVTLTSGGVIWDINNSRVILGSSQELLIINNEAGQPLVLRSVTTTGGVEPVRSWANGATKLNTEVIHAFGSGTSYARASAIMGDGVLEGPAKHYQGLVTAGSLSAKACFSYEIDATTCTSVVLEAATTANRGHEIEVINFGTSTNTVTFTVASSGTVIDAGVGASSKTASGAGFVIRFKSLGGDGWVVTGRYLC